MVRNVFSMQTRVFGYCLKCNMFVICVPPPHFPSSLFLSPHHYLCWLTPIPDFVIDDFPLMTSSHFILLIFSLDVVSFLLLSSDFGQADFKQGIVSMSDLRVGAVLTGRVDNTTLFGAFVDIGVGRSGLIHKSNITLDKLPVSQRRRSLALGPGERVEVRVLNVDPQRGRIGLDLIRVLQ